MKLLALAMASLSVAAAIADVPPQGSELFRCQVHRGGGRSTRPDNALETFLWCWGHGVAPEADARLTKDGVAIALHDNTLKRVAKGISSELASADVKTLNWADIRDMDTGSYLDSAYSSTRIATIDSIFAAMASVVKSAHALGATVEAELGSMPHNFNGELGDYTPEDFYTRPEDAAAFVVKTGVDALAISFGTVHGIYKTTPKLSYDVVTRVHDATGGLPLVMHGGSGLTDGDYHAAIAAGIRKVNYYTYGALAGGRAVYDVVRRIPEGLQFHDVAVAATDAIANDIKRVMYTFSGEA